MSYTKQAIRWATGQLIVNDVDGNKDMVTVDNPECTVLKDLRFTVAGSGSIYYNNYVSSWLYRYDEKPTQHRVLSQVHEDIKILKAVERSLGWLQYFTEKEEDDEQK